MDRDPLLDEAVYDRRRAREWLAGTARGDEMSRRHLLQLGAGVGLAALSELALPRRASASTAPQDTAPTGPIVKPLPPELFYVYGSNAEMRWDAMRDQGCLVPTDRFFVRNHTQTPLIDPDTWRLRVFGNEIGRASCR